jgi:hypothetical protein
MGRIGPESDIVGSPTVRVLVEYASGKQEEVVIPLEWEPADI